MATTTLGVMLDDEVRARLKAVAEQQGLTTHSLVRHLVLAGLERLERGDPLPAPAASPNDEPPEPAEETAATAPFLELAQDVQPQTVLRAAITAAYRRPEPECLPALLTQATLPAAVMQTVQRHARDLVQALRAKRTRGLVETLLQEYALSSQEGVALMCLAEALLRIPDTATRDALIRDKIGHADWHSHLSGSRSMFVHAATWGLLLTGRLSATTSEASLSSALTRLIARGGEPVIRRGLNIAMRLMGEQFVLGQTIAEALANSRRLESRGFRYSYDMLGEAALTAVDSARYYRDYEQAIHAIGKASRRRGIYEGPGISIKLSALHPRYARAQRERVMTELLPRLVSLVRLARSYDIGINIDAEEADRLDLSLDLLEALCFQPELEGWNGIGFVVQAYQKRTPAVIEFLIDLARRSRHRLMVRLVKGAYWDTEIKRAQVDGLEGFPVFTRKIHTDVCYLACARKLLGATEAVFPQFATHNAQTLSALYVMAGEDYYAAQYEFQCLHGMGEPLYEEVVGPQKLNRPCRIYAPVGTHETLLPYLVRRLLENGANTSFVNQIANPQIPLETLTADPVGEARAIAPQGAPHPKIAAPLAIFGAARKNSVGFDLSNEQRLASLAAAVLASTGMTWQAVPILADGERDGAVRDVTNPADRHDRVGTVVEATPDLLDAAFAGALKAASIWQATPPEDRAAALRRAADLLEAHLPTLVGLIVREAGKTLPAAIGEVREAVDFLRYYAGEVARDFGNDTHRPLGPVVAISPWNFPLSIFTGQIAGALAAGNVVLAKPAEETPLIAAATVRLLHEAGVPRGVLQLVPGDGSIGAALVADPRVRGVVFTGSTEAARSIQRSLAGRVDPRGGPIPLIAETGGQNAMVVDSSALAEQAIADILSSGFDSAGQRCSALRILLLQEEIADSLIEMLHGAMQELRVGRPDRLDTDVGPVITAEARDGILRAYRGDAWPRLRRDQRAAVARLRGWHLRAADTDRNSRPVGAGARGVRAGGACGALPAGCARRNDRPGEHTGLRTYLRCPQPRGRDDHPGVGADQRRQHLRQPQYDRRSGGRAAVRWSWAVRHRTEGGRTAVYAPHAGRTSGSKQVAVGGGADAVPAFYSVRRGRGVCRVGGDSARSRRTARAWTCPGRWGSRTRIACCRAGTCCVSRQRGPARCDRSRRRWRPAIVQWCRVPRIFPCWIACLLVCKRIFCVAGSMCPTRWVRRCSRAMPLTCGA